MSKEPLLTPVVEQLIDKTECAKRIGVSVPTLERMMRDREVVPAVSRNKTVRFHWPSVVRDFDLKAHKRF